MQQWIKTIVMLGVFSVWAVYMGVLFIEHVTPPTPLWAVPGATYTILSGRVPGLKQATKDEQ